jgi:hypothetical protein
MMHEPEEQEIRAQILEKIRQAEESLAQGLGRIVTEDSMRLLPSEVKARARARLATESIEL